MRIICTLWADKKSSCRYCTKKEYRCNWRVAVNDTRAANGGVANGAGHEATDTGGALVPCFSS